MNFWFHKNRPFSELDRERIEMVVGSVLKRDPEPGSGEIGIENFDLGRDRAGSGLEILT